MMEEETVTSIIWSKYHWQTDNERQFFISDFNDVMTFWAANQLTADEREKIGLPAEIPSVKAKIRFMVWDRNISSQVIQSNYGDRLRYETVRFMTRRLSAETMHKLSLPVER